MKPIKLLPCAHCGSGDVRLMRNVNEDGSATWNVSCHDCGISTCSYPETGYDEQGNCEEPYTPVPVDDVMIRMEDAINSAVTIWNTRAEGSSTKTSAESPFESSAESCPSARLDLEGKSNDELVAIAKECQDVLGRKVINILKRIHEVMEDKDDD